MKEERNPNREKVKLALVELAGQAVSADVDLWPSIRSILERSTTFQKRDSSTQNTAKKMSLLGVLFATTQSLKRMSLRGAFCATKQSRASKNEIASQKTLAMTWLASLRKSLAMTWLASLRKSLAMTWLASLRKSLAMTRETRNDTDIRQGESSMITKLPHKPVGSLARSGVSTILRVAVVIVCVFTLLTAALLATPQGRAWARNALLFFTRRNSSTLPIPTQAPASLVEVTPVESPVIQPTAGSALPPTPRPETLQPFHQACGSLPYPRCGVSQIAGMVDFPVKGLTSLPEGFEFIGATGGPDQVALMYQGLRGSLYLAQSPANLDDLQDWEVAADTLVEAVSIGSLPGEYVLGGWAGLGITQPGVVGWEQEAGKQTLRWEQYGIRYTLWFYASKTGDGPVLDKTRMVELAAQLLKDTPSATGLAVVETPRQSPFLTLQQAAVRAGFEPVEPSWLPAGYELAGATYSPERNAICLHYRYRLEAAPPSLTLFESYGRLPSVEEIKVKQFFEGQQIDIPTELQSLEVGGSENGLAAWASNGVNLGPVCGGVELYTNKVLMWRADGMSFALGAMVDQFQGRGFLSNLEMRRVAESLTAVSTISTDSLDPERLASIAAVKSLAGFQVKAPTRMLADLHFDHAVYRASGSTDNPFRGIGEAEEVLLVYLGNPVGDGSDGRFFNLFIAQGSGPGQQPLEELALGGGYEYLTVNGQPALHRQDCWDDSITGGFAACQQILAWFEDGVRIEIDAFLEKALPEEMLIAIAESMR